MQKSKDMDEQLSFKFDFSVKITAENRGSHESNVIDFFDRRFGNKAMLCPDIKSNEVIISKVLSAAKTLNW